MTKKRTIGVLSRQSGVKVTTIRYYESIGLIADPGRTENGQRVYNLPAIERLNFIRHARNLGFPIETIRDLIALQDRPTLDCAQVDQIASRQLVTVRQKLKQLKALEAELEHMLDVCEGGIVANCKVLQSLSNHRTETDDASCESD